MSSPTDSVINTGPAVLLREARFRKQGRVFIRQLPELFHVIRFEGGKHASADFGHFHVWVLVIIPFAHEAVAGTPFPANPARALPSISKLLGHLAQRAAIPWAVTDVEDAASAANDITAALRTWALPFLDGLATLPAVAAYLDAGIKAAGPDGRIFGPALHLAAIRCHQNQRAEASLLLARLESDPAPGIVELARATRARLSL